MHQRPSLQPYLVLCGVTKAFMAPVPGSIKRVFACLLDVAGLDCACAV